jgi:DNA-binding NarL/FixJ family response regulator
VKSTLIVSHENPIMQAGFAALVDKLGSFNLVQCDTSEATLQACKRSKTALLVCSFSLPSMGALQLSKRAKAISADISIIVCGADDSGYIAEKCILSGAQGYITTSITVAEFATAITAVNSGAIYTQANVSQKLALKKIHGTNHVFDSLSPREFDIFAKVINDKTAKEVAQELFLAEKTVANYISIIKKKLRTKTSAGLLRVGLNEGFIPGVAAENGAFLSQKNLGQTNLSQANLSQTNLSQTNLSQTNTLNIQ